MEKGEFTLISTDTASIIKQTVPLLEKHGETITNRFYHSMFTNHPELLNVFNITHQKQKTQPRALARTLLAAAANIDQLHLLAPAVERIAHKHRSIGVVPEQYAIVGKHLLQAIEEVLGPLASKEVMEAWEETYWKIADIFIQEEEKLYQEAENQIGGWRGFRPFVVERVEEESEIIRSFYLKPLDQKPIVSFLPGQYVSIKAQIPGEKVTHIRQYSLSDSPLRDYYRISVKREDARGDFPPGVVSNYLHGSIKEGSVIELSAPAGHFTLDLEKSTPVVFICGGVGFTPLMSMLNTLVELKSKRSITWIHAAINGRVHSMGEHVRQLAEKNDGLRAYVCYENPTEEDRQNGNFDFEGRIEKEWLKPLIPQDSDIYFCGPVPFMKHIQDSLWEFGVSKERMHYEFFGSDIGL